MENELEKIHSQIETIRNAQIAEGKKILCLETIKDLEKIIIFWKTLSMMLALMLSIPIVVFIIVLIKM